MDRGLMEDLGLLATQAQLDFIDDLLDQADLDLSDYTDTERDELSKEEASEIIDELKGDLGYD